MLPEPELASQDPAGWKLATKVWLTPPVVGAVTWMTAVLVVAVAGLRVAGAEAGPPSKLMVTVPAGWAFVSKLVTVMVMLAVAPAAV